MICSQYYKLKILFCEGNQSNKNIRHRGKWRGGTVSSDSSLQRFVQLPLAVKFTRFYLWHITFRLVHITFQAWITFRLAHLHCIQCRFGCFWSSPRSKGTFIPLPQEKSQPTHGAYQICTCYLAGTSQSSPQRLRSGLCWIFDIKARYKYFFK